MIWRAKSLFGPWLDRRQRLGRNAEHVAGALLEPADLPGRLTDRPAHLPGDFLGNRRALRHEGSDGALEDLDASGERRALPARLGALGALERCIDRLGIGEIALDIDPAIDRTDGSQTVAHVILGSGCAPESGPTTTCEARTESASGMNSFAILSAIV